MALFTASASITRPANSSSYAAGQNIATSSAATGSSLSFVFPFPSIKVWGAAVCRSGSTNTGQYRLHMFNRPPTVSGGDGTSMTISGVTTSYLGSVTVDASSGAQLGYGNTGCPIAANLTVASTATSTSNTLYGVLVATTGITNSSGDVFNITLTTEPLVLQQ